jgi:C4-dicarboxylate-specific signal transduction histidine kinase
MGPVDLKQVLLDVGRILAADAMFRKTTLRSSLPASLPTIIGNRTQLLQALINLVLNAFDAVCEEGVETREVEIRASELEPGQVDVAVSDSGRVSMAVPCHGCLTRSSPPKPRAWEWASRLCVL